MRNVELGGIFLPNMRDFDFLLADFICFRTSYSPSIPSDLLLLKTWLLRTICHSQGNI